ncbi:hypothetical protein C6497_14765 [Candidatus Poribacteria bacterium]|nr:MAG: hypothetical protein C6497_14765 [Candidatus Poribacteria bacterium]
MLRNPSRVLFYFLAEIRKLAVNIGGYLLYSDYAKIGVTEKCYDFVTFSHKNNILFSDCPVQSNYQVNKDRKTYNYLLWSISRKKMENTKTHNFRILTILKKTPMNTDCDRADRSFSNGTPCDKKCNILNDMIFILLLL